MWWTGRIAGFCILVLLSYTDIRSRQVSAKLLICSNIAAVLYHLCVRQMNAWVIAGGAAAGALFLLLSKVTREGIGFGDSWAILILGIYLGIWKLTEVLCAAFVMLGVFSAIVLCRNKMSRKCTLPFFPFLTGGYLLAFFP